MSSVDLYTTSFGRLLLRKTDHIAKSLLKGAFWEEFLKPAFDTHVKPGDKCIDVGANLGFFTIYMSKLVGKDGIVYAVEPIEHIFHQLCGNLFLNECYNVHAINVAAYSSDCKMAINKRGINVRNGVIDFNRTYNIAAIALKKREKGNIQAVALDSIIDDDISFIKVDAQGCDLQVMKGIQNIIVNSRPVILFEYEPKLSRHNNKWKYYKTFFEQIQYKLEKPSNVPGQENWLALPS